MSVLDLNFANDDLDQFEDQLSVRLKQANPDQLYRMIGDAAAFLDDDDRYSGQVNPTHINNATSTICRAARLLRNAALPEAPIIHGLGNRGTEEFPFGDITFTDGTRVGYAKMADPYGFQVFRMETFGAPEVTGNHLKAAREWLSKHGAAGLPATV